MCSKKVSNNKPFVKSNLLRYKSYNTISIPKQFNQKQRTLLTAQTARFVRAPSSQVGESCPLNALRSLPHPPTPACQYLSQNKTIEWLLSPSLLPSPTVSYHDCRVRMHSAECKIIHMRFGVDFNRNLL